MTRKEWKKRLPLIQAFTEGKTTQIKLTRGWVDNNNPTFDVQVGCYRIKPEPKLTPFTFEDNLVGKVVRCIRDQKRYLIVTQDDSGIFFRNEGVSYPVLLKYYTFLDGGPCGKYVEEE